MQLQPVDDGPQPGGPDLELIRGEVSCRRTGNLTEARPRGPKGNEKRVDKKEKGDSVRLEGERGGLEREERAEGDSERVQRNSYTHPVCG